MWIFTPDFDLEKASNQEIEDRINWLYRVEDRDSVLPELRNLQSEMAKRQNKIAMEKLSKELNMMSKIRNQLEQLLKSGI